MAERRIPAQQAAEPQSSDVRQQPLGDEEVRRLAPRPIERFETLGEGRDLLFGAASGSATHACASASRLARSQKQVAMTPTIPPETRLVRTMLLCVRVTKKKPRPFPSRKWPATPS